MTNIVDQLPEDIKTEFEVDDEGRVFAKSARAVARLAGVSIATLSNNGSKSMGLLTRLQNKSKNIPTCLKPFAGKNFDNGYSLELILAVLEYYGFHSKEINTTAFNNYFRIQGLEPPKTHQVSVLKRKAKISIKGREKICSNKLAKKLLGQREVVTLGGHIDVLTQAQVIEVKEVKSWKSALGQVLVYGRYYPSHQKRVHLFGETQEKYLELVQAHCDEFGVLVTWEP